MNWGKWIVVSFILFALFIGTLVTVCVREDVSLVSKNYYQEELQFQQQITRMNNTDGLTEKPAIRVTNGMLEISFNGFASLEKGHLTLFRPSDGRLDKQYELQAVQENVQRFDVSNLPAGMYKAKMSWSSEGKEYYLENIVNL